MTPWQ